MKIHKAFGFYNTKSPEYWGINSDRHLDMGCGAHARNPFRATELFGADIVDNPPHNLPRENYFKVGLRPGIPVEDEYFDSISAFDFIEHLNRSDGYPNSFISFMNEASRILRIGGWFLGVTPAFPSPASFQDPTHTNIITESTIEYFLHPNVQKHDLGYGFTCRFELVEQFWVGPFSAIRKPDWSSSGINVMSLLETLSSPSSFRRHLSGFRKPSHLAWVLRKI